MAGNNKQIDLWPADPFTWIDPWSLHTFPENFMQIGPAQPFSRNVADKETKKERKKSREKIPRPPTGDRVKIPKVLLILGAAQRNLANTFVLIFPTDLPSQIFKLISN